MKSSNNNSRFQQSSPWIWHVPRRQVVTCSATNVNCQRDRAVHAAFPLLAWAVQLKGPVSQNADRHNMWQPGLYMECQVPQIDTFHFACTNIVKMEPSILHIYFLQHFLVWILLSACYLQHFAAVTVYFVCQLQHLGFGTFDFAWYLQNYICNILELESSMWHVIYKLLSVVGCCL